MAYTTQYPPAQSSDYVKATTINGASYYPYFATDPAKSVTGSLIGTSWQSTADTNQRFHVDLGLGKVIKRIYYENCHHNGGVTDRGVKDFTFWGSNIGAGTFDDLVWGNDEGWTELTVSTNTMLEHVALDQADPQYIATTNAVAYRYYAFKFANDYGSIDDYFNIRRIELQTEDTVGVNVIALGANF